MKFCMLPLLLIVLGVLTSCGGLPDPMPADCSVYPAQSSSPYVLPYPVGTSYRVTNTTGHPADYRYAIDFEMAIGSSVTAARSGRVHWVEESFFDTEHLLDQSNYVAVLHDDNTLAVYGHLTHFGVLVNKGDLVTAGDPIALSGNSGLGSGPHLHFDVRRCAVTAWSNEAGCPAGDESTVPLVFRNTVPNPCGLQPGTTYTAQPF